MAQRPGPGDDALVERFASLNVWRHGDERAPHKPLLLLWALARLQRGEPRLTPFREIEPGLGALLRDFGPPRATRPEYPFWHLQSDGLWVVPARAALQADIDEAPHRHNPRISVIRGVDARGGLPEELDRKLRSRPELVNRIVQRLLDDSFPPSLHQEILDAVGMPWVTLTTRPARDAAFRDTILRIYEHRCAVCGYDAMLGSSDLGLEAAHVRWHAAGGPDTEDNGLALCALHHKAFDRGAIGLDHDRRILVSQHVRSGAGSIELLVRFTGRPLLGPQPGCPPPAPPNIAWHRKEVFREPARSVAAGG